MVMTRWHMRDLTGKIMKSSAQRVGSDEWEVIEFPAIMPSGNPLWPEFWKTQRPKRAHLSSVSGGKSGTWIVLLLVNLLFSRGTQRF